MMNKKYLYYKIDVLDPEDGRVLTYGIFRRAAEAFEYLNHVDHSRGISNDYHLRSVELDYNLEDLFSDCGGRISNHG